MAPFLNFIGTVADESTPPASAISARYWRLKGSTFTSFPAAREVEFALLGQTAHGGGTAISSTDFGGFPASRAFDGNTATEWLASSAANNEWIGKDFGSDVSVNVVRYLGRGNGQYFSSGVVEYSSDGSSWTTGWTISTITASADVLMESFPDPNATTGQRTLWSLNISDVNGGGGTSIVEWALRQSIGGANAIGGGRIYGRNSGSDVVANAIDGNTSTFWGTTDPVPKIIYYEFENHYGIVEMTIQSRASFASQAPKDFKLQSSPDGVTWTDRITVTGQTGWSSGGETRTFS